MLYISRVTDNGYYITDTEDGVEEVVDKEQLTEIIELGLKVQGISTYNGEISIRVYNPESILAGLRLQGLSNDFSIDIIAGEVTVLSYKGIDRSVKIPNGVTYLSDYSFYNASF